MPLTGAGKYKEGFVIALYGNNGNQFMADYEYFLKVKCLSVQRHMAI